jgi:hypothetical protein
MDAGTEPHLAALKAALKTLKDSGPTGFEGLLAAVLSENVRSAVRSGEGMETRPSTRGRPISRQSCTRMTFRRRR